MSRLLPVKQYYPQTDSRTQHGQRMCFSSTCAMGLKYLLPDSLKGSSADDDYLKRVLMYGDTTEYTAQIKALKHYGILGKFATNGTAQTLIAEIDKGNPVAVGFLHHGPAHAPRGGGHWILVVGYTDTHVICHDPYGELDNVNGGYTKIGSGGREVRYSWNNWLPRWEVDGPGTGWYLTLRKTAVSQTTYPNDWTGVVRAAVDAGSKFPEVVAAQWALESGWGKHTSGKNNYFGIKGKGSVVQTTEFINGKETPLRDEFKNFNSLYHCVEYLVTRWYKDYGAYRGVNRAKSTQECCQLLVTEGYATDPKYAQKLIKIISERK
jgi:hypothetical protein